MVSRGIVVSEGIVVGQGIVASQGIVPCEGIVVGQGVMGSEGENIVESEAGLLLSDGIVMAGWGTVLCHLPSQCRSLPSRSLADHNPLTQHQNALTPQNTLAQPIPSLGTLP